MNKKIAVFAKTPGLSPIKTRLAKTIGEVNALDLYKLSLDAVLENVKISITEKEKRFIAIGEELGANDYFWDKYRDDFTLIWTGSGGLGDRLSNVYTSLYSPEFEVCITGSDSPHIMAEDLQELIDYKFTGPQTVLFGPSVDGGFYFFKSNKPIPSEIWTEITYSQNDTLQQIMKNLNKNHISVAQGSPAIDIDDYETLKISIREIESNSQSTISQNNLANWFRSHANLALQR